MIDEGGSPLIHLPIAQCKTAPGWVCHPGAVDRGRACGRFYMRSVCGREGGQQSTRYRCMARWADSSPPLRIREGCTWVHLYLTALIMSKIGRYMATTIPPTMRPRKTIMTGSMAARRPLTAESTSSS